MASLTFYGGVGQIGGNKVLLHDGDCRLLLDFGLPFARRRDFFEEYLNPRPGAGLLDFLETGLLPPLSGLYRTDLETPGLWARFNNPKPCEVQGVLLSHAHLDHSGYISFLRPDIPVLCTALTAFVAKAMQDSGRSDLEHEVCYSVPRHFQDGVVKSIGSSKPEGKAKQRPFWFREGETLSPAALDFWKEAPGQRPLDFQLPASADNLNLALRHFPLDHSVMGACAWAIETSAGWVVYTGDIRFHGKREQLSREFIRQASRLKPVALIGEGTYLDREHCVSEAEVLAKASKALAQARGLVIADFAPRDVERLVTFLEIARQTGRHLVVLPRDAYLLQALHLLEPEVPDVGIDPRLRIYQELRVNSQGWEKKIYAEYKSKLVSAEEVHNHQEDYILCFSFFDINELVSIQPRPGGTYLYSTSEPHGEEGWLDVRCLNNWLRHFDLHGVGVPRGKDEQIPHAEQGLHASGHASGPELIDLIREIHPKVFFPIHTEEKNYHYLTSELAGSDIEVSIPQLGEEILL